MSIVQGVTFGIALLGAVLGVINTWKALDRDRVKLRVSPKVAHVHAPGHDPTPRLCIDVINLSSFAVTICDVGFRKKWDEGRLTIYAPIILDGKPWPRRLEAREAVTCYCSPELLTDSDIAQVSTAYAKTECGVMVTGKSPALQSYVAEARQLHKDLGDGQQSRST